MMYKSQVLLISILLLGIGSGCQREFSKIETKSKTLPIQAIDFIKERRVDASNEISPEKPKLFVQYETKGKNVYVECVVSGISFRELDHSKQKVGKMIVWIDGKKKKEVSAAAFIIKGLPYGKHRLKIEVVNLQNKPYGLSKEFSVKVPIK